MKGASGIIFLVLIIGVAIAASFVLSFADYSNFYGQGIGEVIGGATDFVRVVCSDSDKGKSIYLAGTCTDRRNSYKDKCAYPSSSSGRAVVEYYCSGNMCASEIISCPDGFSCKDGKCVSQAELCKYGTATASEYLAYGTYRIYSDLGSNNAWARIVIKKVNTNVDQFIINQGESRDSFSSSLTVSLNKIRALEDGTVSGADIGVGPLGVSCRIIT